MDERLDIELLDSVAAARPDWQLVIIGPVAKIDPETLPRRGCGMWAWSAGSAPAPRARAKCARSMLEGKAWTLLCCARLAS